MSTYNDGSADAPVGTPEMPKLLAGYLVIPPWQVAGVNYYVGVPQNLTLLNPDTISMAGVQVDASSRTITITGNNVTLSGYDFSLNGGWGVEINPGVTNTTIENSNFVVGSNQQVPIDAANDVGNLTVINDTFNGSSQTSSAAPWAMVNYDGNGTFTSEYCLYENTPEDAIDFGQGNMTTIVEYNMFNNLGTQPGAHADSVQYYQTNSTNSVISFNTITSGEEGIQIDAQGGSTLMNTTVENNVVVAQGTGITDSYLIAVAAVQGAADTVNGVVVESNYLDWSSAYGPFYGPDNSSNLVYGNNINMVTGAAAANPPGTTASDILSVTAAPASGIEPSGSTITFTLTMDQTEFVTGTPTLALNDGGSAVYVSGSGSKTLVFSYTVASTDTAVPALAITGVSLPTGANIVDANGNSAILTGAVTSFTGLGTDPVIGVGTPTVSVSISTTDLNLANTMATVTFAFSAAPTAFTLADTAAVGGTLSGLNEINATTYTATFTAGAGTDIADGSVSVTNASWTDANGAAGAGGSTSNFTVDTVTPTVSVSINSTDVNLAHDTAAVTFSFSEAPVSFTLADTAATGGTLSGLTKVNATTYTAVFTAAANTKTSAASVGVTAASWSEVNGNAGAGGSTGNFTVDTVTPPKPSLSPLAESGVEGTAIPLNLGATVNTSGGDTYSLSSLTVSAIPVGAVLSDGSHTFTATKTATSVSVLGWTLSNLTMNTSGAAVPDKNVTLTVTATEQDSEGNVSATATANESITVTPEAPTLIAPTSTSGVQGAAIALGTISATVNALKGDSNSLASLVISAIPVGAVLSDGTHSFTASATATAVDVHTWNLTKLTITPPAAGSFTLAMTATEKDAEGNLSTTSAATELVTVSAKAPTGFTFAPDTASLGALEATGLTLAPNTAIGSFAQTGGIATDTFTFTLGGPGATAFSSNSGVLDTGSAAVSGSSAGELYALTVQVNDTTNGTTSGPLPFDVVVDSGSGNTINLTQGTQNLGLIATTPTFIYSLGGNDTLNAAGMSEPVWFAASAGQDSFTGGSGADTYLFGATADSTPALPDIITNFNVSLDVIDLTGIGSTPLTFRSTQLTGSKLASDSIAWQQSGGNTFVYVNDTGSSETTSTANMKIQLDGDLTLTAKDFVHH